MQFDAYSLRIYGTQSFRFISPSNISSRSGSQGYNPTKLGPISKPQKVRSSEIVKCSAWIFEGERNGICKADSQLKRTGHFLGAVHTALLQWKGTTQKMFCFFLALTHLNRSVLESPIQLASSVAA